MTAAIMVGGQMRVPPLPGSRMRVRGVRTRRLPAVRVEA